MACLKGRVLDPVTRREFLTRGASLLAGGSVMGASGLMTSCKGDPSGPKFEPLPLKALITGPVEVRAESEDDIRGEAVYFASGENAHTPEFSWVVRDKLTNQVLATRQGDHRLAHDCVGRGTHVVELAVKDLNDGRTATTRFETQVLGPKKPYDLIAVVRSVPGEDYGFLNFLDPEYLGSMRQEVMSDENNFTEINTAPLVYVGSGVTQAPDGENLLLIMDRDHWNVGPNKVIHEYNRRVKWLESLGSSSCTNLFPAWGVSTVNRVAAYATNFRLDGTGEFEIRYMQPEFYVGSGPGGAGTPKFLGGSPDHYLSNHSGLHDGPHRDFYGKHSSIHPDGFTIAFGPTPFDEAAGEVRRIALYHMSERTRTRFPDEAALRTFLDTHFPAVDPANVKVGENGMAVTPDGSEIAITIFLEDPLKNVLALADISGGGIRLLADDGRLPSFSPTGDRIGYLNSNNHLMIAPVSGQGPVRDATLESGGQGMHDTAFAWVG